MSLEQSYQQFVDQYFESAADLAAYFGIPSLTALLMSPKAPMSKQEWLQDQLQKAVQNQDYEYCGQLTKELNNYKNNQNEKA